MAEIWLTSLDGTLRLPLYSIGPYGSWGDLQWQFRWGKGACGLFEVSWSMPLPPDFEHQLLRRGTKVELMAGPWRMGSPAILAEPAKGTGIEDPWTFTATGMGREVEGDSTFLALDGSGDTTTIGTTAVDNAITRPGGVPGWRVDGRDASIPASGPSASPTSDGLQSVGTLLGLIADESNSRWGVGQDNLVRLMADPTTPTYQIVPGAVALGTSDDDYATVVYFRYLDDVTHVAETAFAPASASATEQTFGRREFPVDRTDLGEIPAAIAQAFADGILALSKGRLAWTNSIVVTSNEILTMGGGPADLSKVAEDVGEGCMVRLHGIWSDLLEYNGQTYLDVIIGEAPYMDGAQSIELKPLGLSPRDLASVVEAISGPTAA